MGWSWSSLRLMAETPSLLSVSRGRNASSYPVSTCLYVECLEGTPWLHQGNSNQVCPVLDEHPLPICLSKRDSLSKLVYKCQRAPQSIRETCPEVPLGCGNYEVSRKKPKNQGATWAESININIPEQAPALGFLCWCANLLFAKGLFTPFWYSLRFIYLHKKRH